MHVSIKITNSVGSFEEKTLGQFTIAYTIA